MAAIKRYALCGSMMATALITPVISAYAAVLPEDRADMLYHRYSGGGVTIDGPAVLVRKKLQDKYSLNAKYYVDNISSASIDVVTTASRYSEKRTEYGIGLDTLQNKTTYSLNYTTSTESDYDAESAHVDISHDFFGDLTTASLGYSQGWDSVGRNGDTNWQERDIDRRNYRASLSQVVSPQSIVSLSWETVADEGSDNRALGNPYRSIRVYDEGSGGYLFESERYPMTRNSDAWAIKGRYMLEDKSVIFAEHREFEDSWGIGAWHVQAGYILPIEAAWTAEFRARHYQQSNADFYADLFFSTLQNFVARDKELSTFDSDSLGFSLSYDYKVPERWQVSKGRITLMHDFFRFSYADFRDIRVGATPGNEPLYEFDANVTRLLFSLWY